LAPDPDTNAAAATAAAGQGGGKDDTGNGGGGQTSTTSRLTELAWQAVPAIGSAVGFIGFVAVVGAAIEWIRFRSAHLPATQAVRVIPRPELVTIGGLALAGFVVAAILAVLVVYLIDKKGDATVQTVWGLVSVAVVEMLIVLFFVDVRHPVVVYPLLILWLLITGLVVGSAISEVVGHVRFRADLKTASDQLYSARDEFERALDARAAAAAARDAAPDVPPDPPGGRPGKPAAVEEDLRHANLAFEAAVTRWKRAVRAWTEIARAAVADDRHKRSSTDPSAKDAQSAVDRIDKLARADEPPTKFELDRLFREAQEERMGVVRVLVAHYRGLIGRLKDRADRFGAWTGIAVLVAIAIAGVVLVATASSYEWLAIMLGVVGLLLAVNVFAARATTKFAWYGVCVFFSVLLYGAALTIARTINTPKVQPIALVRTSDDVGICGVYITQTDDRVYVGRIKPEGGATGRIFWVPLKDVDLVSIGELQRANEGFDGFATQLLAEVYKDRAQEAPPVLKPINVTTKEGADNSARQTTTVEEKPVNPGRPKSRPSQPDPTACSSLHA
jgi:hypothetical protein